jgi:cell division protein FtsB
MKSTASLFIFSPVAAAEELIQHLKSENDKLRAQVDDLRSEVTSIRYAFLLSNSFLL